MKFKLDIQNFGKIEQATIHINYFTVLAGQNNVGKSFVSKALYSFFHAMNTDHLRELLIHSIEELSNILTKLNSEEIPYHGRDETKFHDNAQQVLLSLKTELSSVRAQNVSMGEKLKIFNSQMPKTGTLQELLIEYRSTIESKKRKFPSIEPILQEFEQKLGKFRACIESEQKAVIQTTRSLDEAFKSELKQNFQVSKLQQLKRTKSEKPIRFDIETIGEIKISDESIVFSIARSGLETLQKLTRVIYVESPVYWKLKSALDMSLFWLNRLQANKHLSGVPNYFYDLINLLKLQPLDEPQFKDILEQIEQAIGGRLLLSNNDGNFVFQTQNEGTHALSITALGVANLGMIAMLLEKNLIDEGTFLFIDEPEAHLHPAWQVILMKALFELARKGVNVVITTHSIDMLKCLEVLAKEDEQAKDLIALNHLGTNGHSLNEEADFDEKLNAIKKDLLEPFYQLYLEAL
jgi:predicted ATPase